MGGRARRQLRIFSRATSTAWTASKRQFTGWGLEDSDIVIRMIRAGVARKDGRFATGVLHLWHPEADRAPLAANRARLDELIKSDRIRALRGLSALAPEPAVCGGASDGGIRSGAVGRASAGRYDRAVLALTRGMPANWLGQRLAILFRKLTMSRLGEGCARHHAVGHAAAALSAPQRLREERAVHAANVRHDGAACACRCG